MIRSTLMAVLVALASAIHAGEAPRVVRVSPEAGSGAAQAFELVYADSDGAADIAMVEVTIVRGNEITGRHACNFYAGGPALYLRNDDDTAWIGPAPAGSVVRNSQCAVASGGFSPAASTSQELTFSATVSFTIAFAGPASLFTKVTDRSGQSSEWTRLAGLSIVPHAPPREIVASVCEAPGRDAEYTLRIDERGGSEYRRIMTPSCFPAYGIYLHQEGFFMDRQPMPIMGRTSGHFKVLVAFVDTPSNRQKLLDNTSIPSALKLKIGDGQVEEALTELLTSYTPEAVLAANGRMATAAVSFEFSVALTAASHRMLEASDAGLGFSAYDVVAVIDDLGTASGNGVRRWPLSRHLFDGTGGGFFLKLSPLGLTPGLFGRELMGRNMPWLLTEYIIGERTLVVEGGVTYDRTPVINPRTGENLEPLMRANQNPGAASIALYLRGYEDIDRDGIVDCIDPEITATADNVDADFIPDRFDPDLSFNHRPFSWILAPRGGR